MHQKVTHSAVDLTSSSSNSSSFNKTSRSKQAAPAGISMDADAAAAAGGTDFLDLLPDSLLILIFNKVADIKALGRCCAVSKRFLAFAPLADTVVVKVDCVISSEDCAAQSRAGRNLLTHLVRLVVGSIVKPLQALHHLLAPPRKAVVAEVSHHSPGEVLKNFKGIKKLRIELPGGELGVDDGVLLKWRAEFGSSLESCVILGAASTGKPPAAAAGKSDPPQVTAAAAAGTAAGTADEDDDGQLLLPPSGAAAGSAAADPAFAAGGGGGLAMGTQQQDEAGGSIPESFYTDGELKLRVVWTISSLIAASARHYLLKQIIAEHPTLESLVLTDADGQGMLCMGRKQLLEFRDKPLAASASANRTQVPALNMKLWYAPRVDLAGGVRLNGATLVAIRPSDTRGVRREDRLGGGGGGGVDLLKIHEPCKMDVDGGASSYASGAFEEPVASAFEEPFKTAAAILIKRRTYLLEMNSF